MFHLAMYFVEKVADIKMGRALCEELGYDVFLTSLTTVADTSVQQLCTMLGYSVQCLAESFFFSVQSSSYF